VRDYSMYKKDSYSIQYKDKWVSEEGLEYFKYRDLIKEAIIKLGTAIIMGVATERMIRSVLPFLVGDNVRYIFGGEMYDIIFIFVKQKNRYIDMARIRFIISLLNEVLILQLYKSYR